MAWKPKLRVIQWSVAGLACAVLVGLAAWGRTWPFVSTPVGIEGDKDPSIWQYLLGDRTTLGFVRVGLILGSLFVVASVVALAVAGRWMSGLGRITVDEKESSKERVEEMERQLKATEDLAEAEAKKRAEVEEIANDLLDRLDLAMTDLGAAESHIADLTGDEDEQD